MTGRLPLGTNEQQPAVDRLPSLRISNCSRHGTSRPSAQEALTMEYLVTMTTHVPDGISEESVQSVRTREAAHSGQLAAQGHLLRLWRPPLQPGEWRTLGLFAARDGARLEEVLASMPLRVWRTDEVTPLSPHPNDPGRQSPPNRGAASF